VKASRTPEEMTLYFVEIGKLEHKLIPMEAKYHQIDSTVLKFNVLKNRLDQELTKGKAYRLYLSYNDGNEIKSIISKDIIHWN
ncbi:hypothetical protein K0U07_02140, partial [bacterium]|nr:hypothetical protein [bacterium]